MNEVSKSDKRLLNATETRIAQRFTDRLDSVLDRQGAPKRYADRLQYLVQFIDVDISTAERLLSAKFAPTLVELEEIASKFCIEPGFFIDAMQRPQFRSLRRITGLNGGELLHIELPRGFDQTDSISTKLGWLNGVTLTSRGINASDIVVVQLQIDKVADAQLYVFETSRGFSAYSCKFLNNSKALFLGGQKPEGMLLSLCPQGAPSPMDLRELDIESMNRVICIIRKM